MDFVYSLKNEVGCEELVGPFYDEDSEFDFINHEEKGWKVLISKLEGYIHCFKRIGDYYISINNFSESSLSLAKSNDMVIKENPIELLESIYDNDLFNMDTVKDLNEFWSKELYVFNDGRHSEGSNINFDLLKSFIPLEEIKSLKEEVWN